MHLKALLLKNFRNYSEEVVFFSPKMNLILGENAQGKTNLLEAIFLFSTGRSFRTTQYSDLISHGKSYFYLEARFENGEVEESLKIHYDSSTQKKIVHNETHFPTFSSLLGILPTVFIVPSDIHLIEGTPEKRRRFINLHLAQIDPLYGLHLTRFVKSLKQRNVLLKQVNHKLLEAFEIELSRSAMYLMKKRLECVEDLQENVENYLHLLSSVTDHFEVEYSPSLPMQSTLEALLAFYEKSRIKDQLFGNTQYGPHRDDLTFFHEKKKAKIFSSEGQKRTALLALKFAEWQRLQKISGLDPLFCIDDFTVHLDPARLFLLTEQLKKLGQVFLTAPEEKHMPAQKEAKTLVVSRGKILGSS